MTGVSFGNHSKMTARVSERDRIRNFFGDVLGCRITNKPDIDIIRLGTDFSFGVAYEDSALSESEALKSIWLELWTEFPEELKRKIVDFGVKQLEYWDKEHFYFQAPGGQVFRLAGPDGDALTSQK